MQCLFLYGIVAILLGRSAYFNTNLVDFIGIYIIVGFIKKWMNKEKYGIAGKKLLIIGMSGWISGTAILNMLGLAVTVFQGRMHSINHFSNPFFICIGIGLVLMASNGHFYSKRINYLSGMSLLVYVIHAHRYMIDYVRHYVFDWILERYSYRCLSVWIVLFAIILYGISMALSVIYTVTIQKTIHKLSEWVGAVIEKRMLCLAGKMEKRMREVQDGR